jgi:hypothetical protein
MALPGRPLFFGEDIIRVKCGSPDQGNQLWVRLLTFPAHRAPHAFASSGPL